MRVAAIALAIHLLGFAPTAVACDGSEASVTEIQLADLKEGRALPIELRGRWFAHGLDPFDESGGSVVLRQFNPLQDDAETDAVADATSSLDAAFGEPFVFTSVDLTKVNLQPSDLSHREKRLVVQLACDGTMLTGADML